MRASGVTLTPELEADLRAVIAKHGGRLDSIGHPTTTLEDYFLRIVEESKTRPGRRYIPGQDGDKTKRAPAPAPQPTPPAPPKEGEDRIKEQR